jgi:hypothetical protein
LKIPESWADLDAPLAELSRCVEELSLADTRFVAPNGLEKLSTPHTRSDDAPVTGDQSIAVSAHIRLTFAILHRAERHLPNCGKC